MSGVLEAKAKYHVYFRFCICVIQEGRGIRLVRVKNVLGARGNVGQKVTGSPDWCREIKEIEGSSKCDSNFVGYVWLNYSQLMKVFDTFIVSFCDQPPTWHKGHNVGPSQSAEAFDLRKQRGDGPNQGLLHLALRVSELWAVASKLETKQKHILEQIRIQKQCK